MSNIKITTNSGSNISIAVKPSTSVSVKQGSQPAVSIKGVVGAVHDLTGTDFGFLYKSGDNKISTSAITYDVNSQKVTFPGGIEPLSIYDQNGSRGTSGQILSSTGTALDWINLTEIAGVNGSGTANYVAKWTDGDSITDSTIYDDGTNVGIGTTVPTEKLDVVGNIRLRGTNNLIIGSTSNGGNFSLSSGIRGYNFSNNNGDLLRIDSTGNVGIGTTSPSWKLHVNTTTRAGIFGYGTPWTSDGVFYIGAYYATHKPLLVQHHASAANNNSYFFAQFRNGDDEDVIQFRTNGSADFNGNLKVNSTNNLGRITVNPTTDSNDAIGIDERGFIAFADGGVLNTRFRGLPGGGFQFQDASYATFFNLSKGSNSYLNTTGNFGIGTTSPRELLEITKFGNPANIRLNHSGGTIGTGDILGSIQFSGEDVQVPTDQQVGATISGVSEFGWGAGSDARTAITFSTRKRELDAPIEYMRLNYLGNLGIGTSTPDAKLHVAGNIKADLTELETSKIVYYDVDSDELTYGAAPVQETPTLQSVTDAGNTTTNDIGIGNVVLRSSSYLNVKPTSNYGVLVRNSGDDNKYISMGAPGDYGLIKYKENTGSSITINSTGVGIGTTSPNAKLHIQGAFGNNTFKVKPNSDHTIIEAGQEFRIATTNSGDIKFQPGGVVGMFISGTDRNVGIGTSSPSYKLDVSGDARVGDYLRLSSAGTYIRNNASDSLVLAGNSGYIETGWGHRFSVRDSSGTTQIRLYGGGNSYINGGNVGIGTTSPSHKLHVVNGSNTLLVTRDVSTAVRIGIGTANPSYSIELGTYTEGIIGGIKYLFFQNGNRIDGVNRMAYKSNYGHFFYPTSSNPSYDAYGVAIRHLRDSATNTNDDVLLVEKNDGTDLFKVKSSGDITITGTANIGTDLTVEGNLTVNGTTTTLNTTELTIEDKNIVLANGAADSAAADGAGITIDGADATMSYNSTKDSFDFNKEVVVDKGVTNQRAKLEDTGLYISRTSNGDYSSYIQGANNNLHIKARSDIKFIGNQTTILTVYESSQSVGIGTTSPSYKLDVVGDIRALKTSGIASVIAEKDQNFVALNADATSGYINYGHISNNRVLRIVGNGSEVARFDTSGNVGIGTDSPSQKLDVSGNVNITGAIYGGNEIRLGSAQWLRFGTKPTLWADPTTVILRGGSGNDAFRYQDSSGNEKLRITSDGKVGIEVTNPLAKLHVSSTTGWGGIFERGIKDGVTSTYSHNYSAGNAHILGRGLILESSLILSSSTPDASTVEYRFSHLSNKLILQNVVAGVTTNQNVITFDSDNVGIGTDSPGHKLDVAGDIGVGQNDGFYVNNTNVGIERNANDLVLGGYGGIRFKSSATNVTNQIERMRLTSDGKLGIGTTSPGAKLDIQSPAGGQSTLLKIKSTNSSAEPMLQFDNNINTLGKVGGVNGGGLRFTTLNNVEAMRITSAGNIGIGTSSPSAKLFIAGGTSSGNGATFTVGSSAYNGNLTNASHSPHRFELLAGKAETGGGNLFTYVKLINAGTEAAGGVFTDHISRAYGEIDKDITSLTNFAANFRGWSPPTGPNTLTHHYGINIGALGVGANGTVTNNYGIYLNPGTAATNNWGVYQTGVDVDNYFQGNVGIGVTSPLEQLQVHDNSGGNITISGTTGTPGVTFGTIDFYTYTAGHGIGAKITATKGSGWVSGNLLFHTGVNNSPSPRMIITDTGNVGIGTTSPNGHLHVIDSGNLSNGGIFIENTGNTGATLGLKNTEGVSKLFTNNGITTLRNTRTGFSDYSIDVGGLGVKIKEGNGTQNANASAILDLDSTTQGVLFPRMTGAQRTAISSPATGLIVYQTDADEGLYIYKSTGWIQII